MRPEKARLYFALLRITSNTFLITLKELYKKDHDYYWHEWKDRPLQPRPEQVFKASLDIAEKAHKECQTEDEMDKTATHLFSALIGHFQRVQRDFCEQQASIQTKYEVPAFRSTLKALDILIQTLTNKLNLKKRTAYLDSLYEKIFSSENLAKIAKDISKDLSSQNIFGKLSHFKTNFNKNAREKYFQEEIIKRAIHEAVTIFTNEIISHSGAALAQVIISDTNDIQMLNSEARRLEKGKHTKSKIYGQTTTISLLTAQETLDARNDASTTEQDYGTYVPVYLPTLDETDASFSSDDSHILTDDSSTDDDAELPSTVPSSLATYKGVCQQQAASPLISYSFHSRSGSSQNKTGMAPVSRP